MGRLHASRRLPSSDVARLISHWHERDRQYRDGLPLDEDEAEAIRAGRVTEALTLPPEQQARALAWLEDWAPPIAVVASRHPDPAVVPHRVR